MNKGTKKWIWAAFAVYCVTMGWLLFVQRLGDAWPADYWAEVQTHINLTPLGTVRHLARLIRYSDSPSLIRFAWVNLAGNVLMFVPLGVFLPWLWPALRKWWRFGLCLVGVIVAIETTQLVMLLGVCDVDDLILNTAGGLVGFAAFHIGWRLYRRGGETDEDTGGGSQ